MAQQEILAPLGAVPLLTVVITGRIEEIREISGQNGTMYLHKMRLPAADAFDHPPVVQVRHTSKIGKINEVRQDLSVRLGGYPERWKTADGMRERIVNTLDVI